MLILDGHSKDDLISEITELPSPCRSTRKKRKKSAQTSPTKKSGQRQDVFSVFGIDPSFSPPPAALDDIHRAAGNELEGADNSETVSRSEQDSERPHQSAQELMRSPRLSYETVEAAVPLNALDCPAGVDGASTSHFTVLATPIIPEEPDPLLHLGWRKLGGVSDLLFSMPTCQHYFKYSYEAPSPPSDLLESAATVFGQESGRRRSELTERNADAYLLSIGLSSTSISQADKSSSVLSTSETDPSSLLSLSDDDDTTPKARMHLFSKKSSGKRNQMDASTSKEDSRLLDSAQQSAANLGFKASVPMHTRQWNEDVRKVANLPPIRTEERHTAPRDRIQAVQVEDTQSAHTTLKVTEKEGDWLEQLAMFDKRKDSSVVATSQNASAAGSSPRSSSASPRNGDFTEVLNSENHAIANLGNLRPQSQAGGTAESFSLSSPSSQSDAASISTTASERARKVISFTGDNASGGWSPLRPKSTASIGISSGQNMMAGLSLRRAVSPTRRTASLSHESAENDPPNSSELNANQSRARLKSAMRETEERPQT